MSQYDTRIPAPYSSVIATFDSMGVARGYAKGAVPPPPGLSARSIEKACPGNKQRQLLALLQLLAESDQQLFEHFNTWKQKQMKGKLSQAHYIIYVPYSLLRNW